MLVKRSRRGGRRPQNGHNGHIGGGGGGGGGGGSGGFNPNRTYDSNGPEVKIRGTASHIYEKYLQLARDANAVGDRVMAENYLQHAEHYFRIMAVAQAQQAAWQAQQAAQQPRPTNGTGEQPGTVPAAAGSTSAPSFSLAEGGQEIDETEEEGEESEVAE
jgi:hypothetical protein